MKTAKVKRWSVQIFEDGKLIAEEGTGSRNRARDISDIKAKYGVCEAPVESPVSWKVEETGFGNRLVVDAKGNLVANLQRFEAHNAELIAATPELLQVIKRAILNGEKDGPAAAMSVLNTFGRAVIAKAEGGK